MPVLYRSAERADYGAIRHLLIEVGWEQRVADLARFEQLMAGATKTVVALDGDRLVGFGRALTDSASNGYISTLAVARDHRRLGIGRQLVTRLMDLSIPEGSVTWVLRSARGSEGFWQKMGFRPSTCAMEIVRTRKTKPSPWTTIIESAAPLEGALRSSPHPSMTPASPPLGWS